MKPCNRIDGCKHDSLCCSQQKLCILTWWWKSILLVEIVISLQHSLHVNSHTFRFHFVYKAFKMRTNLQQTPVSGCLLVILQPHALLFCIKSNDWRVMVAMIVQQLLEGGLSQNHLQTSYVVLTKQVWTLALQFEQSCTGNHTDAGIVMVLLVIFDHSTEKLHLNPRFELHYIILSSFFSPAGNAHILYSHAIKVLCV